MKQHIETYEQFINEELIRINDLDVYVNPASIKRMNPWKRAISDVNGNLYVLDDPYYTTIHRTFTDMMYHQRYIGNSYYNGFVRNEKLMMWQQVGDSNTFCLSISDTFTQPGSKLIEKVQKKNPKYKFLPVKIWEYAEEVGTTESGKYKIKQVNEELMMRNNGGSLYRNPKNISKMAPWLRAMSDADGNLFVFDHENLVVTHAEIGVLVQPELGDYSHDDIYKKIIPKFVLWHRAGGSDNFYLSESYPRKSNKEHSKLIDQNIKVLERKFNYSFFNKRIWSEFNEPQWKDMRKPLDGPALEVYRK